MSGEVRCWYLNQKGKATGPYAFSDLKSMAAQGSLKGHDLVFREGSAEWKRAYDWPELVQECFSDENRSSLSRLIKLPEEERAVDDQWVLLVREDGEKEVRFRQKGPFQTDEIRRMLVDEKIKPSDHIWKKGAARWVPLYDVPEFRVHNLKMTKAAEAALTNVQSMPDLAQAHADPFAAMMPATPDVAQAAVEAQVAVTPTPTPTPAPAPTPTPAPKFAEPAKPVASESAKKASAVRASIPVSPQVSVKAPEAKSPEAANVDLKSTDAKTAEAKVADVKPADVKPAEPKPVETPLFDVKPAEKKAADVKPADSKSPAGNTPDRQAIREWALGLVEKAQKNDPELAAPGKAQVFSPEVTNTDHEISVVANASGAPQSSTPQSLAKSVTPFDDEPSLELEDMAEEIPELVASHESDIEAMVAPEPLPEAKPETPVHVAAEPAPVNVVAETTPLNVVSEPIEIYGSSVPKEIPAENPVFDLSDDEPEDFSIVAKEDAAVLISASPEPEPLPEPVTELPAAALTPVAVPVLKDDHEEVENFVERALRNTASFDLNRNRSDLEPKASPIPSAPETAVAKIASAPDVTVKPAPVVPDFSDELTPIPSVPVSANPTVTPIPTPIATPVPTPTAAPIPAPIPNPVPHPMPVFASGAVVPDDGSAEEVIPPARLKEDYFETKTVPKPAATLPQAAPQAKDQADLPQALVSEKPAPGDAKLKAPAKGGAAAKAATPHPAGASTGAATGKAAAAKPAAAAEPFNYDFEPPKTFFSKAAPFFGVMVIAIFGAGVWATLNTDKSVFQSSSSASQIPIVTPPMNELPPVEPVDVPPPQKNPPRPQAQAVNAPAQPQPQAPSVPAAIDEGPDVITADAPTSAEKPVVAAASEKVQPTVPDKTVPPTPDKATAVSANPAADFDGKNPIVRITAQNTFLEIMGPFRKGELLRIRIEGRAGQILDLPALVQKYEVRAAQDHYYRVSVKEARIPKGEYLVGVQFGMNRFSRGVGYGKDPGFRDAIQGHRKSISYDQQQERKRLLQATKDFAALLAKAEAGAKDATAIKNLQKELDKKTPRELRLVRTNRYELIFFDYWEKLAAQWERVQVTMKDNPGRNPASTGEYSRARKLAASLESEVRATSIWN